MTLPVQETAQPVRRLPLGAVLVARRVYPAAPNHKLAILFSLAGVQPARQYHRALGDAEMTARLWTGMVENIECQHGVEVVSLELMQSLQACGVMRAADTNARYA